MSTYQWKKMDADLLSMVAKVARDEPLSAAEQLSVAEFLKGHAGTEGDWGFSTTPTGKPVKVGESKAPMSILRSVTK